MACIQTTANSLCNNLAITLDCLEQVYQGESKNIILQLADAEGYSLDLDDVTSIEIMLYDLRKLIISNYSFPTVIEEIETYEVDELDELNPLEDIWITNLPITILQSYLTDDPNTTYINEEDFLNKGKISILITEEISNYLMSGGIYIDLKINSNNSIYIIKCFNIGQSVINLFNR